MISTAVDVSICCSIYRICPLSFILSHHLEGCISVGGSALAIFRSTLMGFISWLGGSIWAISIRVTPRDQISALKSYGLSFEVSHITTSGAILSLFGCMWKFQNERERKERKRFNNTVQTENWCLQPVIFLLAHQYGVPMKESRLWSVFVFLADTPKSAGEKKKCP